MSGIMQYAIFLTTVFSQKIHSIQIENVTPNTNGNGLLILSGECQLALDNMRVAYCTFDSTKVGATHGVIKSYSSGNGVRAKIHGITMSNNTNSGLTRIPLVVSNATPVEQTDIQITGYYGDVVTATEYGNTGQFPVVKKLNYDNYHWKEGGKHVMTGTAAPTTGTWAVGDKVINTAPAAGGFEGWVCTTAGTPGTWFGYGLIAS